MSYLLVVKASNPRRAWLGGKVMLKYAMGLAVAKWCKWGD